VFEGVNDIVRDRFNVGEGLGEISMGKVVSSSFDIGNTSRQRVGERGGQNAHKEKEKERKLKK